MSVKIFTNGCFDVLHLGHIELLKYCADLGEVVVGLNSDSSVKRLKGPSRPINSEQNRLRFLESIKYVHSVHIFHEDTPYELIKSLKPDLIVKGGDYKPEQVAGHDLCEVRIFETLVGHSSTAIIQKISNSQIVQANL
jgi:D-beta-D-heptose 7-phosphate kinase/D-beta-D-heptose 1-phosphate adenosyltransferase